VVDVFYVTDLLGEQIVSLTHQAASADSAAGEEGGGAGGKGRVRGSGFD